jgi:hypothetical protein
MDSNVEDDRQGIGSNLPPTPAQEVRERLPAQYADLAREAALALSRVTVPDSIDSDEEAVAAAQLVAILTDVGRDVEKALRKERLLYKDATQVVVTYFTDIVGPVGATISLIQSKVRSYQVAKANAVQKAAKAFGAAKVATRDAGRIHTADGKVAVSAVSQTVYRIVDAALIPRDLLRPDPVLINARIHRLQADGAPLEIPGLVISEELRTSWRRPKSA